MELVSPITKLGYLPIARVRGSGGRALEAPVHVKLHLSYRVIISDRCLNGHGRIDAYSLPVHRKSDGRRGARRCRRRRWCR